MNALSDAGVKLILMRCAGFNNVDMDAAKKMRYNCDEGSGLFA